MTSDQYTLEQLSDMVAEATGNFAHFGAAITFKRTVKMVGPSSSALRESPYVMASVQILGSDVHVSGGGADHRSALVALLQAIERHHSESIKWHQPRLTKVREILDTAGIYYIKPP